MKKITLKSATDELIGAGLVSSGVVAGSLAMKMASGKLNPWLVPLIGIVGGYGIRLVTDNSNIKDVGTGLLIAGTLDLTKKALQKFGMDENVVAQSIPTLSGPGDVTYLPSSGGAFEMLNGVGNVAQTSWQLLN
jgi:hypothetical protein